MMFLCSRLAYCRDRRYVDVVANPARKSPTINLGATPYLRLENASLLRRCWCRNINAVPPPSVQNGALPLRRSMSSSNSSARENSILHGPAMLVSIAPIQCQTCRVDLKSVAQRAMCRQACRGTGARKLSSTARTTTGIGASSSSVAMCGRKTGKARDTSLR